MFVCERSLSIREFLDNLTPHRPAMSFYDLPPELVLEIGSSCLPSDAFSLALCCRSAHAVLQESLSTHQKLSSRWHTIKTQRFAALHKKVAKFTKDERLSFYVRVLRFDCWFTEWEYSSSDKMAMVDRMQKLRRNLVHVFDESRHEIWQQDFILGLQHSQYRHISDYMLYMVPGLHVLECFGDMLGENDPLELLVKVARASSSILGLPLQHLKVISVHLDQDITEGGLPLDWLLASMHLPCVRTFEAVRMGSCKRLMTMDEIPISNLESITFQDSMFEPEDLVLVLSKIRSLKSFVYSNGRDSQVYDGGSFSPKRITAALLLYAGHSLEHLALVGRDHDVSRTASAIQRHPID